jgi:hypothetical protein
MINKSDIKFHNSKTTFGIHVRVVGEYGGKIYSRKFPAEGEDRTNEMQLALLGQFRRTFSGN